MFHNQGNFRNKLQHETIKGHEKNVCLGIKHFYWVQPVFYPTIHNVPIYVKFTGKLIIVCVILFKESEKLTPYLEIMEIGADVCIC